MEQQRHRAGVRKLGAPSESAVHRIEHLGHLGDRVLEHLERRLAGRGLVQVVADHAPHRLRLRLHLSAPRAICVEHALEHGTEAGPAMRAVGRKVGAAVEHLAGGREKGRQRPAALPGQRLHRPLVAGVDVRPLVPVHLDADEVLVQELGECRILVGLAVHHVAPVAPDGADVEQHGAVLRAGGLEGLVAPGIPVDGLMGGGLQVGRGGGPEAVRGHRWLYHRWKVAKRAHMRAPFECCGQRPEPPRQDGFLWLSEYTYAATAFTSSSVICEPPLGGIGILLLDSSAVTPVVICLTMAS